MTTARITSTIQTRGLGLAVLRTLALAVVGCSSSGAVATPTVINSADAITETVAGPQVLVRDDCTIWVGDGWRGEPGPLGSLILRRQP